MTKHLSPPLAPRPDDELYEFVLGAHPPKLTDVDIQRIHELWLRLKNELKTADLRHRDVVSLALTRLEHDLTTNERAQVLRQALKLAEQHGGPDDA